jgi:citrate lyase subunit beta/citryl-CoA lyase
MRPPAACGAAAAAGAVPGAGPVADRAAGAAAAGAVAVAGAAADVVAIDTVYTDLGNTEGLRADAETALNFGFDGKAAIHPSQIEVINEVFTPSEEKIEWAEGVLEARDAAGDKGVFEYEGEMIDAPVLSRAEEILRRAGE